MCPYRHLRGSSQQMQTRSKPRLRIASTESQTSAGLTRAAQKHRSRIGAGTMRARLCNELTTASPLQEDLVGEQLKAVCLIQPGRFRAICNFVSDAAGGSGRVEVIAVAAQDAAAPAARGGGAAAGPTHGQAAPSAADAAGGGGSAAWGQGGTDEASAGMAGLGLGQGAVAASCAGRQSDASGGLRAGRRAVCGTVGACTACPRRRGACRQHRSSAGCGTFARPVAWLIVTCLHPVSARLSIRIASEKVGRRILPHA